MRRRKSDRNPLRLLVLISQIGITMMVPIFFCAWLGLYVSSKTGIDFLFLLFLILGIMSGFRSCYSVIRRFISLKNPTEPVNLVNPENLMNQNRQAGQGKPGQEKPDHKKPDHRKSDQMTAASGTDSEMNWDDKNEDTDYE